MRFLHTADWHVGKKLGRIDRTQEFEKVFDELVEIAIDEKVDAVLVAGDLFDRPLPPLDSIRLVVDALLRLAEAGGQVVAIAGNHDSAALFEVLGRLLRPAGVHLVPRVARPESGGVIQLTSEDGSESADIGVFPFLHEAEVVDFMAQSHEWHKAYTDKTQAVMKALVGAFNQARPGLLMAHYFIDGSELGGGERRIHLGQQYAATAYSIPPEAAYVALGHIHRPQAIEGAASRARYAGSLLQLDFSERTHNKEVVIVDVAAGVPAKVKSLQLRSGRKLVRVEAELESLSGRVNEFADAYLDVRVKTSGPVIGLFDQVKKILPNAVMVQAVYERAKAGERFVSRGADDPLADLYADYFRHQHGSEPTEELLAAMRSLEDEVAHAAC